MIIKRTDFNVVRKGLELFAIGGKTYDIDKNEIFTDSIEIYTISTNLWNIELSLEDKKSNISSILLNNRILLVGGKNESITFNKTEYIIKKEWIYISSTDVPKFNHEVEIIDNKIVVIGGLGPFGNSTNNITYFDNSKNMYSSISKYTSL